MTARKRRIMRELVIQEISAVDRPAQQGAKAVVIKRDDQVTTKVAELVAKRYIDPSAGAVDFDQIMRANLEEKRYYEAQEVLGPALSALNTSLHSIVGDTRLETTDKEDRLRNSVESFLVSIRSRWADVEQAIQKHLGESTMPDNINELRKQVEELTAERAVLLKAKAEDEDKDKKDKMEDEDEKAKTAKQLDDLQKQLDAMKAERDAALAKVKMSDKEKNFLDTLPEADKGRFLGMDADERKAMMDKAKKNDETLEIDGTVISKSAVGDSQFAVFKAQQDRALKLQKQLDDANDRATTAVLTKRAQDELPNLPGEVVDKVAVLKAVDSMDEAASKALGVMLKAGNDAIASAFERFGAAGGPTQTGPTIEKANSFDKRVDEIVASERLSRNAAMRKAIDRYPDEFEAWQEQGSIDTSRSVQ